MIPKSGNRFSEKIMLDQKRPDRGQPIAVWLAASHATPRRPRARASFKGRGARSRSLISTKPLAAVNLLSQAPGLRGARDKFGIDHTAIENSAWRCDRYLFSLVEFGGAATTAGASMIIRNGYM